MRVYQYKVSLGDWHKIISFGKKANKDDIIKKIIGLYPGMNINAAEDYKIDLWATGDEIDFMIGDRE